MINNDSVRWVNRTDFRKVIETAICLLPGRIYMLTTKKTIFCPVNRRFSINFLWAFIYIFSADSKLHFGSNIKESAALYFNSWHQTCVLHTDCTLSFLHCEPHWLPGLFEDDPFALLAVAHPSVRVFVSLQVCTSDYSEKRILLLGDSGRVVNSLDFCPASLKSLGCFYFRCVLSSQGKAVTVNLRILYCQR